MWLVSYEAYDCNCLSNQDNSCITPSLVHLGPKALGHRLSSEVRWSSVAQLKHRVSLSSLKKWKTSDCSSRVASRVSPCMPLAAVLHGSHVGAAHMIRDL